MKSSLAIFTGSLLLSVLPYTLAAPTNKDIKARWSKGTESSPIALSSSVKREDTKIGVDVDDDGEDDYIVILAEDETRDLDDVIAEMGCNRTMVGTQINDVGFRGFSMKMKKSNAVTMFSVPNVQIIEKNVKMHLAVMPKEGPTKKMFMSRDLLKPRSGVSTINEEDIPVKLFDKRQEAGIYLQQSTAPWNLQRLSSEDAVERNGRRVTDLSYQYRFDQLAGAGVDVYLLDTGINVDHVDFGGRAQMIHTIQGDDFIDHEGHGTHTAGTVGSRTFGVAKNVNILGMKVFSSQGDGSLMDTIEAINIAVKRHTERSEEPGFAGSVISMSLGAQANSVAMKLAIENGVKRGVHFSVAAGNEGADACESTPAGISAELPILTVGATDITDTRAVFTNIGDCTNIYAPGVQITSTFIGGNTATNVLQGTSMSCPLVTGLIATELALNPDLKFDVQGMKDHILGLALQGVVADGNHPPENNPLLLAYNGFPGNP